MARGSGAGVINEVTQGDCLELLPLVPNASVDMILCDLPYGTTACKWDTVIPFEPLWAQYRRVLKPGGAVVLTASQPFTHALIASNLHCYKYSWVWDKRFAGNFVNASRTPLRVHEDVLVFSFNGGTPQYFPVMQSREVPIKRGGNKQSEAIPIRRSNTAVAFGASGKIYTEKFPSTILAFNGREGRGLHPTQKPVALFEYLIRTYTNEGDTVLDNCCGSGTTGVACQNTGRNFIQMEMSEKYCEIARERLNSQLPLLPEIRRSA